MKRFLVVLIRRPDLDPAIVPLHMAWLERLREQGRVELSGPFGDKSGGAYLLQAVDLADATSVAEDDPAHLSGGWQITVYEWQTR